MVKIDIKYSDKGVTGSEKFNITIPEDADPDTITAEKDKDNAIIISVKKKKDGR